MVNGPPQDLPCLSSCGGWEQKHNLPGKMLNEDVLKKPRRPPKSKSVGNYVTNKVMCDGQEVTLQSQTPS